MDTAAKILTGILLALLVYIFYIQYMAPYFIESSQSALMQAKQFLAKDLVTSCKEWTDNLALKSQFPPNLEAKALTADVGWEWCQKKYFTDVPDPKSQARCRASCVKLLRVEDHCDADPTTFGLQYDDGEHTMTVGGQTVDVTREGASQYCVYERMPIINEEVLTEFP